MKGFVELSHDAFYERAVTVSILDEDHERFLGETGSVLGLCFIRRTRTRRHSHASFVGCQGPCAALNRRDEQLAHRWASGSFAALKSISMRTGLIPSAVRRAG